MSLLLKNLRDRQIGRQFNKQSSTFEMEAESYYSKREEFKETEVEFNREVRTTFITEMSPDGHSVACSHGDHTISIISLRTLKVRRILEGHSRSPWTISWGPKTSENEYIIASGCLGGTVFIWFDNGTFMSWFCGRQTAIASIAFHPSQLVVVFSYGTAIKIWDLRFSRPHLTLLQYEKIIRYVGFDNYGNRLLAGIKRLEDTAQDLYHLVVWDFTRTDTPLKLNEGKLVASYCKLHNDSLVAINNDFTLVATLIIPEHSNPLKQPKLVGIYSLAKENLGQQIHCLQLFTFGAVSLSFSPSSKYFLISFNMVSGSFTQIFDIRKVCHMNSYPNHCIKFTKTPESTAEFYKYLIQHEMRSFLVKNCNVRDYVCICNKKEKYLENPEIITCRYYPNLLTKIITHLQELDIGIKLSDSLRDIDLSDIHEACLENLDRPKTDNVRIRKYITLCSCLDNALTNFQFQESDIRINCVRWAKHVEYGILIATSTGSIIRLY